MPTILVVAFRNVLRNRRRTLITLAALVIGVAVMVSMRGLLNGLQRSLVVNVSQGNTGALQVHKKGYFKNVLANPLTLDMPYSEVLAVVRRDPQVTAAAARINFAGMINFGDQTVFSAIIAIDPKDEPGVCPLRASTFEPGSDYPGTTNSGGVLLTSQLATSINIKKGDEGAILSNDRDGVLSGENIRLVGTMNLSIPGEKKIALAPLGLIQRLLKMEDRATEVAVAVEPIEAADDVAARLRTALGPDYEVQTWAEVAMFVRQAMARQNLIISLVAFAFMFLMLLGVANTTLMSVLERTREVGTMMAVGLRRDKILALFLVEALAIGLVGSIIGAVIGWGVTMLMAHRGVTVSFPGSGVPFVLTPFMTPEYVLLVIGLASLGAVVFSLYPAFRASRLRPVQALAGQ